MRSQNDYAFAPYNYTNQVTQFFLAYITNSKTLFLFLIANALVQGNSANTPSLVVHCDD